MPKQNQNKENKINYNSFLEFDNNNKLDKDEDRNINEDIYINIDSKNYYVPTIEKDLLLVNQRIERFKGDECKENGVEDEIQKKSLTKDIMKKFLGKLYPNCEISARKISYSITKDIRLIKKLSKDTIEEYINYFFGKRYDIKYSTSIKFTKDFFRNCGYLFCYIYSKLNDIHIKKIGGLKSYILNKVIQENINVIVDFYDYCTEKEYDLGETKKAVVWKNLNKKYEIPPELIFLVNILQSIDTLEFDIEFDGEILNEEDLKLFTITILNISYILPKLEKVKINFINNELQYFLYQKYYRKIQNIISIGDEYIKKNKIKNNYFIYNKKWDFEHEFNLEEYRQDKYEKEKKKNKYDNITFDKYSILYHTELINNTNQKKTKKSICNSTIFKVKTNNFITINEQSNDFEIISNEEEIEEEETDLFPKIKSSRSETIYLKNNNSNKINTQEPRKESIDKDQQYSIIYDIILMIICGVTRIETIKKIYLLSNDFYNRDLIIYLKKYFGIDVHSIDEEFHTLDLLYNKTKNLDELNLEINSLDILSFDKILGVIYKNQSLISLRLSLFSSDVSYLIFSLLKSYELIKSYEEINEYVSNEGKYFCIEKFEEKIVNDISICFIENLNLLFEIIKNKNNLEVLGLNFDLPNILKNNMNYKSPIIKFILNIILLIDNNENKDKSKITKLTLLSPYSILDNRLDKNINEVFNDLTIYKNSKKLKELNIQLQLYKMTKIKNLISPNLVKLSIGDLDVVSFDELVKYLTSYEFSSQSVLTNLSIKLLKKVSSFNTKIKLILRKLFEIKIKSLLELKIFSNLIITNKVGYIYLIKIIKNNWIPSYVITLNEKSDEICTIFNFLKNEAEFLVTCSIEKQIFSGIPNFKKDQNDQKYDINDEVYWILKYIFYCRYSDYHLNFLEVKNIIFSILKYLYMTSKIKLSHKIEEPVINP